MKPSTVIVHTLSEASITRIQAFRMKHGWCQTCRKAGVSESTLRVALARDRISATTLRKLVEFVEVLEQRDANSSHNPQMEDG